MHKIKTLLLVPILLLCTLLTGCNNDKTYGENGGMLIGNNFELICNHGLITYYRDETTDIIYIVYSNSNQGGFSVYYNSEGKPMSYPEFKDVHHH